MDGDIIQKLVVVANNDILIDDTKGTDDVVVSYLCLWVNDRQWMDLIHARTILLYSNFICS